MLSRVGRVMSNHAHVLQVILLLIHTTALRSFPIELMTTQFSHFLDLKHFLCPHAWPTPPVLPIISTTSYCPLRKKKILTESKVVWKTGHELSAISRTLTLVLKFIPPTYLPPKDLHAFAACSYKAQGDIWMGAINIFFCFGIIFSELGIDHSLLSRVELRHNSFWYTILRCRGPYQTAPVEPNSICMLLSLQAPSLHQMENKSLFIYNSSFPVLWHTSGFFLDTWTPQCLVSSKFPHKICSLETRSSSTSEGFFYQVALIGRKGMKLILHFCWLQILGLRWQHRST